MSSWIPAMDDEESAPLLPRPRLGGPSSLRGPESLRGFGPGPGFGSGPGLGFGSGPGFGPGPGPGPAAQPPLGPHRPASLPPGGSGDHHDQFCNLVGVRPINHPHDEPYRAHPQSLYIRAAGRRRTQSCTYMFTATLINVMLLTQVVLGAALTGLGASNSSRVLITVFGALNTVIAGVVAFMKSRGQPMRARMFRDDLSRVVDEIENSAVMWYGISQGHHGYGAIDTDDQVTVRGEVARLTRLYDKAVKNNTMNDPDMYSAAGGVDSYSAGLRKAGGAAAPAAVPGGPAINTVVAAAPDSAEGAADDSPASKAPEPIKQKSDANSDKGSVKPDAPAAEDADPATDAKPAADAAAPSADATPVESPAATPAAEAPKGNADDKPAAEPVAAAPAPAPAPPAPAPAPVQAVVSFPQDPDESPASSATPPKREASNKTLVDVS